MKKIDLLDTNNVMMINEFENEILNLVDNQDEFTRSDLQGRASAIVMKILSKGMMIAQEK